MPKMKTKSAAKKRFRFTGSGKIKAGAAFRRHCLVNKSSKMKRQTRDGFYLCASDATIVRKFFPYQR